MVFASSAGKSARGKQVCVAVSYQFISYKLMSVAWNY